jgi:hypothetical protein
VFRWITRQDPSLWTAPFYEGYRYTFAFSENYLGSFPFYFLWRIVGFSRESAFQGWYLSSFLLNFIAACYALLKIRIAPVAAGVGAFIFTFGMPEIAQVGHAQLLYRFCVPLACYCMLKFAKTGSILQLWGISAYLAWQIGIAIYTGIFLCFLLLAMAVAVACYEQGRKIRSVLLFWPEVIARAWRTCFQRTRRWFVAGEGAVMAGLVGLLWPYIYVSHLYGFKRHWVDTEPMLPRLQSYLLADLSLIWRSVSSMITNVPMRHEQQMFVGLGVLALVVIGSLWRRTPHREAAIVNIVALLILVGITLHLGPHSRYTPYRLLARLPGLSAIRAVSRIIVIMLWPIAVVAAIAVDGMWRSSRRVVFRPLACIAIVLVFLESCSVIQWSFPKAEAERRLMQLRSALPSQLPESPILLVREGNPFYLADLDAMLLSQTSGWSTFNGYSGNTPPNWDGLKRCTVFPKLIVRSLAFFTGHVTESAYLQVARRVVPVGFDDCRPEWSEREPSFTEWSGPLPRDMLKQISLRITDVLAAENSVRVRLQILNNSDQVLPSLFKGPKRFYLSGRLVKQETAAKVTEFEAREELDADVPPHAKLSQDLYLPVTGDGHYLVEASAVQELVGWLHDLGTPPARTSKIVEVKGGTVTLIVDTGVSPVH